MGPISRWCSAEHVPEVGISRYQDIDFENGSKTSPISSFECAQSKYGFPGWQDFDVMLINVECQFIRPVIHKTRGNQNCNLKKGQYYGRKINFANIKSVFDEKRANSFKYSVSNKRPTTLKRILVMFGNVEEIQRISLKVIRNRDPVCALICHFSKFWKFLQGNEE